jgi:hypothetical protein
MVVPANSRTAAGQGPKPASSSHAAAPSANNATVEFFDSGAGARSATDPPAKAPKQRAQSRLGRPSNSTARLGS